MINLSVKTKNQQKFFVWIIKSRLDFLLMMFGYKLAKMCAKIDSWKNLVHFT